MALKGKFLYIGDDGTFEEGMDGGLFITDVETQSPSNVIEKSWKSNTIPSNHVIDSITMDTQLLKVTVEWDGTAEDWNGTVSVNGQQIPFANISRLGSNARRFTGWINVDCTGLTEITAEHSSGASHVVPTNMQGNGPVISSVVFTGGYPGSQTEVKNGDAFQLLITFDTNESTPTSVEVYNFGACKNATVDITAQINNWPTTNQATIPVTIDYNGNTATALPARVSAANDFGTEGPTADTDDGGAVDGVNTVLVCDRVPSISFGSKTYPASQEALKDSETCSVVFNYNYTDSVVFSSPNSQLSITDPGVLAPSKTVTRINGDYNISSNNLRAVATRNANATTTTINTVVQIAHVDPVITVSTPATRLRSGGADGTAQQNHTITLSSNQRLRSIPTLSAPEGTFSAGFSGSVPGTSFTNTLGVNDSDGKGTFSWGSLVAENLAGKIQNVIANGAQYTLGGFVSRLMYFAPNADEVTMGVQVSDTSKLEALDKDEIAMTYYNNFDDQVRAYTICEPSNTLNPNGNIIHWNDAAQVAANTTGLSRIRIEEVV